MSSRRGNLTGDGVPSAGEGFSTNLQEHGSLRPVCSAVRYTGPCVNWWAGTGNMSMMQCAHQSGGAITSKRQVGPPELLIRVWVSFDICLTGREVPCVFCCPALYTRILWCNFQPLFCLYFGTFRKQRILDMLVWHEDLCPV